MKRRLKCQRSLILLLILLTLVAHVLYLPGKIAKFSSLSVRRDFFEDIYNFRHPRDYLEPNAVNQEPSGDLKEPELTIYKDGERSSVANRTSDDGKFVNMDLGRLGEFGEKNGRVVDIAGAETNIEAAESISRRISVTSGKQPEQSNEKGVQNGHSQDKKVAADRRLRKMTDQLILAKAYLTFAPPTGNSHLVKELRLRIKEVERAIGDATKDSDMHRSASQKMQSMETTLVKASQLCSNCSTLASKFRAMTANTEELLSAQRNQVDFLTHLAARTIPKGLHCLSLRLTDKYFSLPPEKREFPNEQKLRQSDLYHYAVFSDNILACAVVINSTLRSSLGPEKLVFHVVTDALNLPAMKMWFLANPPGQATIEVQSLDSFKHFLSNSRPDFKDTHSLNPRFTSILNYLRFSLPALFPDLNKILLLDHDVVVQRDLTRLWEVEMKGKVNGAVETCGKKGSEFYGQMDVYVNFSDPVVANNFNAEACTWAFGMNIFDLQQWRRLDLTSMYHKWLELGKRKRLWRAGSLPLGLVTFYNLTVPLDRRWHVLGLGAYESGLARGEIGSAAVIHYNGQFKPWLDIAIPKYRVYWSKFVPYDHPYLRGCNIHE